MKLNIIGCLKNNKFPIIFLTVIVFFCLLFTSCMWRISFDSLTGSGSIASETRNVRDFSKIEITGMGKLIIKQSDKESLKLEGEDNIINKIYTEIDGDILKIRFKSNLSIIPTKDIKFYLVVKDLTSITSNGSVSINGEDLNLKSLTIKLNGAEKVTISGTVEKQQITINGAGYYDAKNFVSKESYVTLNGAGGATVNASKILNATITGAGSIKYVGNPEIIEKINGIGKIEKITND